MARLDGKTALVTGASRGIGRAIAERLAADGAKVLVHYSSASDAAEEVAALTGGSLVQADLATAEGVQRVVDAVEGPLDILVNNAGVVKMVPYGQHTMDDFDLQFAVNVRAPVFLAQSLDDRLAENGRVIFVSTVGARSAFNDGMLLPYSATKGAIETAVVHLAPVLGARGITVNAVAPGIIATDMNPWLDQDGGPDAAYAVQALKRVGQPGDVADVVAFLASHDGRWVTGQVLQAGGGTKL